MVYRSPKNREWVTVMRIGIIGTSNKENERRVPVFPEHLGLYPESLRRAMVFETGYGKDYGLTDAYFKELGVAMETRDTVLGGCDLVVLPKPMPQDLEKMRPGQVLFGWPHAVQQKTIAQLAIEKRITVIAWEAMHLWSASGDKPVHVFYKNNELAGYAAVLHSLQLLGLDGYFGPPRKVVILSHGAVSRGAIYALRGRGFNNIYVFSRREPRQVGDQNPNVYYGHYYAAPDGTLMARGSEGNEQPLIDELAGADIICNGILQDIKNPVIFVGAGDVGRLKPRSLIIDISCDEGMGFAFARPTSFAAPVFTVGDGVTYYSVDHTPSYLWNAASREISKALLPYLGPVAAGRSAWAADPTIRRAIEIQDGVVLNPNILEFQRRRAEYPHNFL
ncbi:MAG: alanine dehydrogenase [Candidatus Aminicenantales bacterium]